MSSFRLSYRDVLVVGSLTIVFAGFAGAVVDRNRETANRVKCASNLKQLGMAAQLYANENRGAYPRTTYERDAAPVWGTPYADDGSDANPNDKCDPFADEKKEAKEVVALKPKPNDVTAALFLLLRTQDLVPEVFICPSTRLKRFDYGGEGDGALSFTNFPGKGALAKHLSYSYQNPYPTAKAIASGFKLNNSITAEFATMADLNPGSPEVKTITVQSPLADVRKANSANHQSDGQNVLYGDGHVEFVQNPLVGVMRDNIYLANDPSTRAEWDRRKREGEPAFAASPVDADDSILLPTAADIGQDTNTKTPITPIADVAALQKQIQGTFAQRNSAGRPVVMTIDETTIKASSGPSTVTYRYKIAGMRGKAIVLALTADEVAPAEVELKISSEMAIYIDSNDEVTGAFNGGWARRAK